MQGENMTKRDESKNTMNLTDLVDDHENRQRLSWVTDIREQRKKKKTYAERLQSGYEKERSLADNSTIQDISAVMNNATKEIYHK